MKRSLAALFIGTLAIGGCADTAAPDANQSQSDRNFPRDRDGWVDAFNSAIDHARVAELAIHYLEVVDSATAHAWAAELRDDRFTPTGMLAQLADAKHALREFGGAAAAYHALLVQGAPYVSRGRLLYRLAFVNARATLDDETLDRPGKVERLYRELLAIDTMVLPDDEIREHLDYMIAVMGALSHAPDHTRLFRLADAVRTDSDSATKGSRLTLLDLAIDAAATDGQTDRANRLRANRAAVLANNLTVTQ